MTDKLRIIDDQKKTIHRLQQECTEKTNIIIALGNKLQAKEQECEGIRDGNFLHALEEQKRADKYFKTLTEIKFWISIVLPTLPLSSI